MSEAQSKKPQIAHCSLTDDAHIDDDDKQFQLLLSPPPSSPVCKNIARVSGCKASSSAACESSVTFKGKCLQDEFENLENCTPQTASTLKIKTKAGKKKQTVAISKQITAIPTENSVQKKKCKRRKKPSVQYWELSTLSSESFDFKRLTERQQLALLTKQSQIEASGSSSLDGADATQLLKSISPFVLDKLNAASDAIVPAAKARPISKTNDRPKAATKTPKKTPPVVVATTEQHQVDSAEFCTPPVVHSPAPIDSVPATIANSLRALEAVPTATPIKGFAIESLFSECADASLISEQCAQFYALIEAASCPFAVHSAKQRFLMDGHRFLARHAAFIEEIRARPSTESNLLEISRLQLSFHTQLSNLLTMGNVL